MRITLECAQKRPDAARQLAAEFIQKGEPTEWFEALYKEGEEGERTVPWADRASRKNLSRIA